MSVNLVWITPNAEQLIGDMARVSNPPNQGTDPEKLIRYMIRKKHWSPFEMVNACVEINTTRDIARQILRHRSFSFQEFSQRYAEPDVLKSVPPRGARLQDTSNRQNSHVVEDAELSVWWSELQRGLSDHANEVYHQAIERGIAKEVARAVLPEGLTPTRMYMNGSLRSWLHYWDVRTDAATQLEHRRVADATRLIILSYFPSVERALNNNEPTS